MYNLQARPAGIALAPLRMTLLASTRVVLQHSLRHHGTLRGIRRLRDAPLLVASRGLPSITTHNHALHAVDPGACRPPRTKEQDVPSCVTRGETQRCGVLQTFGAHRASTAADRDLILGVVWTVATKPSFAAARSSSGMPRVTHATYGWWQTPTQERGVGHLAGLGC